MPPDLRLRMRSPYSAPPRPPSPKCCVQWGLHFPFHAAPQRAARPIRQCPIPPSAPPLREYLFTAARLSPQCPINSAPPACRSPSIFGRKNNCIFRPFCAKTASRFLLAGSETCERDTCGFLPPGLSCGVPIGSPDPPPLETARRAMTARRCPNVQRLLGATPREVSTPTVRAHRGGRQITKRGRIATDCPPPIRPL